ncbi:MAG TPA: DNA-binding response regulator, partial [Actinobacteria bacterium]|nr:DNA-binding response regulator [Actinomycetota bacterium]
GCIVNLHQVQEIIPMFGGSCLLRVKDARRSEILVSRRRAKKLKAMLGM